MADSFTRARTRLLLDQPFFGALALKLIVQEDTTMPTGATDGKYLKYNPKWFEKLPEPQQEGFIAHEIMHIVYMHMLRREHRHHKKWNVAADYVMDVGRDNIREHENRLNTLMSNKLKDIDSISIIGPEEVSQRGGIFSFNIEGWDPTEIAMHLDEEYNIAIRSGMHCVHSWFNSRSIEGTARASVYLYNNEADVKKFTEAIEDTIGS